MDLKYQTKGISKYKTKKGKILPVKIIANYLEYKGKEISITMVGVLTKRSTKTVRKKNKI